MLISTAIVNQGLIDIFKKFHFKATFLFHIYQPIECLLLCAFYNKLFILEKNQLFIKIAFPIFLLVCITYNIKYPETFYSEDFFDFTLEAIFICTLVVLFFLELLNYTEKIELKSFGAFWINAVHLIFYGGCLFFMGFYYYLKQRNPALAENLLYINYFLNLLLYSVYTIVFQWAAKTKQP